MVINKVKPSKKQLEFLKWELGIFFHFGLRTFYEGHEDWDNKEMKGSDFNPSELDCRQWIKCIKEAGAKYAVFVTKHHDGFANWPSKYSNFSVAHSPWKDGKGDVVEEFVNACREYDLKIGLYYSPAEYSMVKNIRTPKEYDDYFINQIGELLTQYGEIDYLWFDGCGSENHEFDTTRIIKEIRRMQPNILIFNMWEPDTRWVGNENGIAPSPCFNTVDSLDFSVKTDKKDILKHALFLPAECDCKLRENWFYSQREEPTIKSLDELMGIYYYSVGRGANLLLNIGPDRRGLLPEKDANRILEFGNEIKKRFSRPIIEFKDFCKTENSYVCSLEKPEMINHLVLKENLFEGEAIKEFNIIVTPHPWGNPVIVYRGQNVGNKAICYFPTIRVHEIRVEIMQNWGNYKINDIEVFYTN